MRVLGINDEVTTCECCGKSNLKRTVVLSTGEGEVHYGTECAARALGQSKQDTVKAARTAERGRIQEAYRDVVRAANSHMAAYNAWLEKTYGDTKSNLERHRAFLLVRAN